MKIIIIIAILLIILVILISARHNFERVEKIIGAAESLAKNGGKKFIIVLSSPIGIEIEKIGKMLAKKLKYKHMHVCAKNSENIATNIKKMHNKAGIIVTGHNITDDNLPFHKHVHITYIPYNNPRDLIEQKNLIKNMMNTHGKSIDPEQDYINYVQSMGTIPINMVITGFIGGRKRDIADIVGEINNEILEMKAAWEI